ncbi:MAG: 6-phosphofructokinase [Clostridia bacterium]|nr:6-phosphofructokinase [Clostridia bacterium]
MSVLYGNAVVGQSGGPTAAINATLAGVIRGAIEAHEAGVIKTLYGMKNGIEGFLNEDFVDLFTVFDTEEKIHTLECTPSAALGSCRRKLKDHIKDADTFAEILSIFKKYDIRYFFYIGGNDSMDTVLKLSNYAADHDYEVRVVGVPKTIDNDLMATDHTPGFGSAAKFVATTMKEIRRDVSVYSIDAVTIVEVMGRDAGWLTASAALPSLTGDGPDLVYLPEKTFDPDRFLADVRKCLEKHPAVLVAASEGIRFADGRYVGEGTDSRKVDAFGHTALSGTGKVLEELVKNNIGCKVRSIELSLPQRCAAHIASLTDLEESVRVGMGGVRAATSGATGVMMTFVRSESTPYSVEIGTADISTIANEIRRVPDEYITADANGITDAGLAYLAPLIIGEPKIEYEYGMPKHFVID